MLSFDLPTTANFLGGVVDNGVMGLGLSDRSSPGGKKSSGHLPFPSLIACRDRVRPSSPLVDFSLGLSLLTTLDPPPSASSATRIRPAVSLCLRSCNPGALESPSDLFLPRLYSSLSEGTTELASARPNESEAKYEVASVVAVLVVPNLPPFAPPWLLTRLRLGSNRLEKVVVSLKVLDATLCLISFAKD